MAIYSEATSRGDWTGEWDASAVTQVLLRLDSFTGSEEPLTIPDSSGRGRVVKVHGWSGTSAQAVATPWGTGLQINSAGISDQTFVRIENDGHLFPSSGSVMVGAWFNGKLDRQWNPVLSTRGTSGEHPLMHLNVNVAGGVPQLNYRLYDSNGGTLLNKWLYNPIQADKWYWFGMVFDATLGTYAVYSVAYESGEIYTDSGTISGINTDSAAHLDVGFGPAGEYSRAIIDEVVMVAPFSGNAGQWALRNRLANAGVEAVQADATSVSGRVSPRETATLPVVVHSRAMPAVWGDDTPQISINGRDATVRYRTSANLTTWSAWKNASQISTEPSTAWIQYEVTLTSADSYIDSILLSTAPPPTPPLPSTQPVQPFSLDPLLIVPSGGGVYLQDTLLQCRTFDTASNESTLTFTVSLADPKATLIEAEMPVIFKGRQYVARGVTTTRSRDTAEVEVYCERKWYDLIYAGQIEPQMWTSTAFDAMTAVLAGSDWYVGQVDPSSVLGWESESGTVLGVLKQIAKIYGGDLVFDDKNRFVHLLNQGGRDRGTYFTYEKGITSAARRVDTTNLVTRIYGKNEEGLTIAPANGGVDYIEDFTWTDEVRQSTYDFKSGMTPQAMMNFLVPFLAARATPNLSYEYNVSGLIDRVEEVDRFEVLDVVFVMDEDYSQSVKNRITQLEIDWLDLRGSTITLANNLRSLASSDDSSDPGELTTGQTIDTRDITPFNLLLNSRGDNGMAHWAGDNVEVVEGGATGRYSFAFGAAGGALEQTVASDNRDSFVFSAQVDAANGANLQIEVTFQYADGSTETKTLEL